MVYNKMKTLIVNYTLLKIKEKNIKSIQDWDEI